MKFTIKSNVFNFALESYFLLEIKKQVFFNDSVAPYSKTINAHQGQRIAKSFIYNVADKIEKDVQELWHV